VDLAHLREVLARDAWIAITIGVGSFVVSIAVTIAVVVRLPADYFVVEERPLPFAGHARPFRWAARVGMNLLGVLLVLVGIVLSLPGVPGQGLLTILFGVMLLDLPGKRALERKIVRRPAIHGSINRLRSRYGRPPIIVGAPPSAKDGSEDASSKNASSKDASSKDASSKNEAD
jgi:hypothetical protein